MEKNNSEQYTDWRNNTLLAKMETDKKYMILKMGDFLISTAGFGWYVLYMLRGIRIAVENGFVPVIDWKNCKLPQYSAAKVGKENVWELFFEQPCNVNVEQAYESEDFFVVDDVRKIVSAIPFEIEKFTDFQNEDTMAWRTCFQKYIRLKSEIKEYFEQYVQYKILNNSIGVLARGTDYAELKPVGHSKPVLTNEIFTYIDAMPDNRRIFLATEDESIFEKFETRYPGRIDAVTTKRYKNIGYKTLNIIYKKDGYERDIKYLYSIYMISKCASCIYSACGGGVMASLMRESYGTDYKFLYHGCNKAKGIIVGSEIEKRQNRMILMGKKPILFYALNTLKLLDVEEVDLILSDRVKQEYQRIIGSGKEFGIKINYIMSDTYNVMEHMTNNPDIMDTSKVILLYSDYFVHGKDVIKELSDKVKEFDGACVWGARTYFSECTESIQNSDSGRIPQKAYGHYIPGNYSLVGRYIFDYELKEIINQLIQSKEEITLTDVLNEYIRRKKLFFFEYKRGIVYSKLKDENSLDKTDQVINLIEEIQMQRIGDFESFRIKEKLQNGQ